MNSLLLTPNSAHAFGRNNIGTRSAQFLLLPVSARATAMGEAYSAVTEESDAIHWNPAGLGRIKNKSLSLMHSIYLQNIFYNFASYAQQFGKIGTAGIGVQYLNAGSIEELNAEGTKVGTFQPSDLAVSLGWARTFREWAGEDFIFGVSAKYIRSQIIETAQGFAFDLGLGWQPLEKFHFSVASQNIGGGLRFKNEAGNFPFNIKLGSAYQFSRSWVFALDVNFPLQNNPNMGIGSEYRKFFTEENYLAGRVGYLSRTTVDISGLSSISAGVGVGGKKYSLDFGWIPFSALGNNFQFSFTVRF